MTQKTIREMSANDEYNFEIIKNAISKALTNQDPKISSNSQLVEAVGYLQHLFNINEDLDCFDSYERFLSSAQELLTEILNK